MSWETISLVAIVAGGSLSVLALVLGTIVTMSFLRGLKARPAKGKAKTKETAADEGYSKKDQSLLAEMAERLSTIEADVNLRLDNFHRRLLSLSRSRQDGQGGGPGRGGNGNQRDGAGDEWEPVDPTDPDVAAAIAAGEYTTPDGQPAGAVGNELPRQLAGSKEERLAALRQRKPRR